MKKIKIGSKVVCVSDRIDPSCRNIVHRFQMPVIGGIYTIKGFIECNITGRLCFYLNELNFLHQDGRRMAYGAEKFEIID